MAASSSTGASSRRRRFQDPRIRPTKKEELKAWLQEIADSGDSERPELASHDSLLALLQRGQPWVWTMACTVEMCMLAESSGIRFSRNLHESADNDNGGWHRLPIRFRYGGYVRPGSNRAPMENSMASRAED